MKTKKKSMMIKTYSEMIQYQTFEDRLRYLRLSGTVGFDTFGFDRVFNQQFYHSKEWRRLRHDIIVRDEGCDLADPERPIFGPIYIHHLNPISLDDITEATEYLLNPDYLVCASFDTHNAIHYGSEIIEQSLPLERSPNDTCPWKL